MFPPLTRAVKALLLINVGVFLVNTLLGGLLIDWLGLSLAGMIDGFGLGSCRLLTYQFVHSYVDIWHLLFNMLMLYFLGTMVEPEVGYRGMVKLYLASGVVGGLVQILFAGLLDFATVPCVGASGSVYGILVYAAFMAPRARFLIYGVVPVVLGWVAGVLVFIGVYESMLMFREGARGGTAHGGHLGGALWGFLAFRYFRTAYMTADHRPWLGRALGEFGAKIGRVRAQRQAQQAAERQAILDGLLDKVHREGMSALTSAERKFLERASRNMKNR